MAERKLTKDEIVDAISNLSVLELAELIKLLEEKFGVQVPQFGVAAPVASGVAASAGGAAEVQEKTEFSVVLVSAGANKIPVIKLVREILGLGLKEAKDFVEAAPKVIKESLPKEQAEDLKKRFVELGATVEIK